MIMGSPVLYVCCHDFDGNVRLLQLPAYVKDVFTIVSSDHLDSCFKALLELSEDVTN